MPYPSYVDPMASTSLVYGSNAGGVGEGDQEQPSQPKFVLDARQRWISWLWGFYKCSNYANRTVAFDGSKAYTHIEHDTISSTGYIPDGFYDAGETMLPVQFRKPSAPYYLNREIVDRFSNLLFSEDRSPNIAVDGDDDSADYYEALADESDLWEVMGRARTFGGAMTSVAVSFSLQNGKPSFEVHDTRWCLPTFEDSAQRKLSRFEKKYVFQDVLRDSDNRPYKDSEGREIMGWFWYRRLITKTSDEVWERVPALDDEEPDWDDIEHASVELNAGRVPVRWIRNLPVEDGIDGEPDAAGTFELIQSFDLCMSAAQRAIIANCDPWLAIMTDDDLEEIVKKVGNALKLNKEATAQLLEMTGVGPKLAMEMADKLRELAFEIAACVPDNQGSMQKGSQKTATEVMALRSRMIEKAGKLRSIYGAAIVDLLEIADATIRAAMRPKQMRLRDVNTGVERTSIVQGVVNIPPRVQLQENGGKQLIPRKLGPGGKIRLEWPRFFEPTLDDILKAVQAVAAAVAAKLIDRKTAATFLRDYLPIGEDIEGMLKAIDDDADAAQAALATQMMSSIQGGVVGKKPPTSGGPKKLGMGG